MQAPVPASETEVFQTYYPRVKHLVSKSGVRRDYIEDYSMTLMTKMLEKDILNQFDPERLTVVNGVERKASFRTFFYGFVLPYLKSFAKRDSINSGRSSLSSDMMMGEENNIPLLDYLGFSVDDSTERAEAWEIVEGVRKGLKEHSNARLAPFFEEVLRQVAEQGRTNAPELANTFGVTRATIYNWFRAVREEFDKWK